MRATRSLFQRRESEYNSSPVALACIFTLEQCITDKYTYLRSKSAAFSASVCERPGCCNNGITSTDAAERSAAGTRTKRKLDSLDTDITKLVPTTYQVEKEC